MKKVLLTGISGFIGQHCAVELIKQGYIVKGSLRSLSKADKIVTDISKHIDTTGKLEFCALDLLKDDGWDDAMKDVDFVMHVASPFFSKEPKDENELIQPAVQGTLRAIKAAHKAGIKRVVLTSSMVAMLGDLKGEDINQGSWTNVNAKNITAYLKSKTLAEKAAWEFIKGSENINQMELVTIHPGPVYGPTLSDNLNGESMTTFTKIIKGEFPRVPHSGINMSDVRDVATIHVKALENDKVANQRFIVASEKAYQFIDLARVLKDAGYDKVSTKLAPSWLLKFIANFNSEMKGMLPYIGNVYNGDVRETMKAFDWKPIEFKKMAVDTAKAIEEVLA